MLKHGGELRAAAAEYQIPLPDWLDLSTGINPNGWPVPTVPAAVWRRLPESQDGLEQTAADYYGSDQLLPVAGSQAAIQLLPRILPGRRVGVLSPAYAEHAHAWQTTAHTLRFLSADDIAGALPQLDVLTVINPNNPTGAVFEPQTLLDWHGQLSRRNGYLIIDEAFIDTTPEYSLVAQSARTGLIILRSLGKFFGLAGVRAGFVFAELSLREQIAEQSGPWTVNSPARWVARQALADTDWQQQNRIYLKKSSQRLASLLIENGLTVSGGTALFQWVRHDDARNLQAQLARQGILVRHFSQPPSLRFGLPGDESAWQRLQQALSSL